MMHMVHAAEGVELRRLVTCALSCDVVHGSSWSYHQVAEWPEVQRSARSVWIVGRPGSDAEPAQVSAIFCWSPRIYTAC